ncbi:hypothetical protein SLEP1_g51336 [Rubroshorea leprosula]|uniref:Uncharacterized protein n=1 Tax=Rubroshorea leprosula TaxID=152421 RepID=A0AAV5M5B6_9ROSI|nr:hypothetical protein SLEP1_g51336 [Rubroshorea leprosula]
MESKNEDQKNKSKYKYKKNSKTDSNPPFPAEDGNNNNNGNGANIIAAPRFRKTSEEKLKKKNSESSLRHYYRLEEEEEWRNRKDKITTGENPSYGDSGELSKKEQDSRSESGQMPKKDTGEELGSESEERSGNPSGDGSLWRAQIHILSKKQWNVEVSKDWGVPMLRQAETWTHPWSSILAQVKENEGEEERQHRRSVLGFESERAMLMKAFYNDFTGVVQVVDNDEKVKEQRQSQDGQTKKASSPSGQNSAEASSRQSKRIGKTEACEVPTKGNQLPSGGDRGADKRRAIEDRKARVAIIVEITQVRVTALRIPIVSQKKDDESLSRGVGEEEKHSLSTFVQSLKKKGRTQIHPSNTGRNV